MEDRVVLSPVVLVIETQPSATATAGTAFATQPVIWVESAGVLQTNDNSTVVTVASRPSGSGPLQGTLTLTVSGGIAAFTNLADDVAETITLKFTSASLPSSSPTSNSIVVSPAAASQLVIHTQPSTTATAGTAFTRQPVIYEEDQYGNIETGDSSTIVTASLATGTGPLEGTTTATVSSGIATFTNLADDTAETITLEFTTNPSLTAPTSNNVVVSASTASQLVISTQPSPTATAGTAFSPQPVVYEEDEYGNVVKSDSSTTVTASLATGTGPLRGTKTVTLSHGVATFGNLSDNTAETITLQFVSNPGLNAPTSNSVVVSAAAASQLVIHTQPSVNATAGTAFNRQPVIYEEDQYGNIETGDSSTVVTAALASGTGPLQGTTTATVSSGIATFTNLADDLAETITLEFSTDPSTSEPVSNSVTIAPAAASQLVIYTQPSATATAGTAFATQPVVYVEDQYGNLRTSDNSTNVAAALETGTGPLQGTKTVTVSGGIATFTNLADNTAETISLIFTSNSLTAATSNSIDVSPATASKLVIHTQPSVNATAGTAFNRQPVIYEEDQYGNIETGDSSTVVTAALASGTGPLQGTTTATVSAGIATFTNLADDLAETITLEFSTDPATSEPVSNSVTIAPAAASQLVIYTQPSPTATAGTAFGTQPVLYIEDQYGNLLTGNNSSSVTASLETGTGPLQGTKTVTASGGIATFTNLADNLAETISLVFNTGNNLSLTSSASDNIVVSPATASKLVIHTQPSANATAGAAFNRQPVIYEEDQYGNIETGDSSTVVTAALASGTGPLQGTTTATVSSGIATFSNLADDLAETITLEFSTDPSTSEPVSNSVTIAPAAASQLVIYTQPSPTATAGTAFATQPVVYVEDQYGNLRTSDNSTNVAAALETGTGPLQGTKTVTVSGGIATFTNLADNTAETISLNFTSNSLTAATSNDIDVSPATASKLVIHTQPSANATAGAAFNRQPVIYEEDQYGNIETGDSSTVVTAALASGTGPLQGTTTATVSSGIATFTNLADDLAETITLEFSTDPALTEPVSNSVTIAPAAASQLVIYTQPSPTATAGTAFATQPVLYIEDMYGNLVTSDSFSHVTASLDTGTGPLQGTKTVYVTGGIATFTDLADNLAETISLVFNTGNDLSLTSSASDNIVVSPATASQLVIHTQPSASATAGTAFSPQPVIYEEDEYGNIETGDSSTVVTAALASGTGPLQGTTTATVSAGVATFTNLADNLAETITLEFTSDPALTEPTSNNVVVTQRRPASL